MVKRRVNRRIVRTMGASALRQVVLHGDGHAFVLKGAHVGLKVVVGHC